MTPTPLAAPKLQREKNPVSLVVYFCSGAPGAAGPEAPAGVLSRIKKKSRILERAGAGYGLLPIKTRLVTRSPGFLLVEFFLSRFVPVAFGGHFQITSFFFQRYTITQPKL